MNSSTPFDRKREAISPTSINFPSSQNPPLAQQHQAPAPNQDAVAQEMLVRLLRQRIQQEQMIEQAALQRLLLGSPIRTSNARFSDILASRSSPPLPSASAALQGSASALQMSDLENYRSNAASLASISNISAAAAVATQTNSFFSRNHHFPFSNNNNNNNNNNNMEASMRNHAIENLRRNNAGTSGLFTLLLASAKQRAEKELQQQQQQQDRNISLHAARLRGSPFSQHDLLESTLGHDPLLESIYPNRTSSPNTVGKMEKKPSPSLPPRFPDECLEYKQILEMQSNQAEKKEFVQSLNMNELTAGAELVYPKLQEHSSSLTYLAMAQMKAYQLQKEDQIGKCRSHKLGYVGLCCKHCQGRPGHARYFPGTFDSFVNGSNVEKLIKHIGNDCKECPNDVKEAVKKLAQLEDRFPTKLLYGSRRKFFFHVWTKLHGDKEWVDNADAEQEEETPSKKSQEHAKSINAAKRQNKFELATMEDHNKLSTKKQKRTREQH